MQNASVGFHFGAFWAHAFNLRDFCVFSCLGYGCWKFGGSSPGQGVGGHEGQQPQLCAAGARPLVESWLWAGGREDFALSCQTLRVEVHTPCSYSSASVVGERGMNVSRPFGFICPRGMSKGYVQGSLGRSGTRAADSQSRGHSADSRRGLPPCELLQRHGGRVRSLIQHVSPLSVYEPLRMRIGMTFLVSQGNPG